MVELDLDVAVDARDDDVVALLPRQLWVDLGAGVRGVAGASAWTAEAFAGELAGSLRRKARLEQAARVERARRVRAQVAMVVLPLARAALALLGLLPRGS